MSMIDFSARRSAAPAAGARAADPKDRPAAQLWLNVGYYVAAPTEEDPNAQKFISLPQGIPLDTMEPVKVQGSNADFRNLQSARNDLLKALQEAGMSFEPGAEDTINLQIQLRRVNSEAAPVNQGDNPYSSVLAGHSLVGTVAAQ